MFYTVWLLSIDDGMIQFSWPVWPCVYRYLSNILVTVHDWSNHSVHLIIQSVRFWRLFCFRHLVALMTKSFSLSDCTVFLTLVCVFQAFWLPCVDDWLANSSNRQEWTSHPQDGEQQSLCRLPSQKQILEHQHQLALGQWDETDISFLWLLS